MKRRGGMYMKRMIAASVLLLLLCMTGTASANSWGLRGDLLDKVSDVNTWNDYSAICKQAGDAAVMGSRYHNALMLVEDGELKVYTTAVYQPGSSRESVVSIEKNGDTLILAYGKYGKGEGTSLRLANMATA